MRDDILRHISEQRETVIDLQRDLTAIPALGPDNGGEGEGAKADYVARLLEKLPGVSVRRYEAPDPRAPSGRRPNLAAVLPGRDASKTLWIISHLDIVPPGDLGLWRSDPYVLRVEGDDVFGRGTEDNHQGLVSSYLTLKALIDTGVTPPVNYGLMIVADEETGSRFGLEYLVDNHPELFGPRDLYLIPDFGLPDSELVEVAEKSIFWLRITVNGKQCHASTPDEGVNSLAAASLLIVRLHKLAELFPKTDPLFKPANSTFEPTKKEANVENVNTIPGRDVFSMDCRVLPDYDLGEVFAAIREIGAQIEALTGVRIEYEVVQANQAKPATPVDSEIVQKTLRAVKAVYNNNPKPQGIGGGTVAAVLRAKNIPAVVWATWYANAHQPNERASISKTIGDAQVMATILF
ncbi:MAG: M20 family metallo-hydrolase, partial [Desulfovibrionaceae bacterium]|nr:M20 family metallo-hydrolase [Desulfovibrionaceae bacterium]